MLPHETNNTKNQPESWNHFTTACEIKIKVG